MEWGWGTTTKCQLTFAGFICSILEKFQENLNAVLEYTKEFLNMTIFPCPVEINKTQANKTKQKQENNIFFETVVLSIVMLIFKTSMESIS